MDVTHACKRCREYKPLEEFFRPSGALRKWCKDCREREAVIQKAAAKSQREKNAKGYDYGSRNAILLSLGFESYQAYLRSDLWKVVRAKVYAAKGRCCYLCDAPATELHHNRYHLNDLIGKRLKYINPICNSCHFKIEFKNGRKTTLGQARASFRRLRRTVV